MAKSNGISWFWPTIVDVQSSKVAAQQGVWAAAYIAGITFLLALMNALGIKLMDFDPVTLVDAVPFMIISWGIHKFSRTAAVAGLFLYLVERAYAWATVGPRAPIMAVFFTLMFVNAVRGTFAFRKFSHGTPEVS